MARKNLQFFTKLRLDTQERKRDRDGNKKEKERLEEKGQMVDNSSFLVLLLVYILPLVISSPYPHN
jgi:hypothetical protein